MFPVKYGLDFHIVFRSNLVFKGLKVSGVEKAECIGKQFIRYTTLADKRRSLGRFSSLADSEDHGVSEVTLHSGPASMAATQRIQQISLTDRKRIISYYTSKKLGHQGKDNTS
jgi:hypothetical protein